MSTKVEMTGDEIRSVQLEVLSHFLHVCKSLGLTCFLAYGTLIGCMRHQGYIPWDDDIDLAMPRTDYDQLIRHYQDERYCLISHHHDPRFAFPYSKLFDSRTLVVEETALPDCFGAGIDIFPIDGFPPDPAERKSHIRRISLLRTLLQVKSLSLRRARPFPANWLIAAGKAVLVLVSRARIVKAIDKRARRYPFNGSDVAGIAVWGYQEREAVRRDLFASTQAAQFESLEVPVPVGFHEWLTALYGDYMKQPPPEKRITHHLNKAYWLSSAGREPADQASRRQV